MPLGSIPSIIYTIMVVHAHNLSTWGGGVKAISEVQGHPCLCSKFNFSLAYINVCLKNMSK